MAWHFRNDEERTTLNFVGPIYWASSAGGAQRTRGILPATPRLFQAGVRIGF